MHYKKGTHTPLGIYMYTISLSLFLPTIKKSEESAGVRANVPACDPSYLTPINLTYLLIR
jgi:hypothetical protein